MIRVACNASNKRSDVCWIDIFSTLALACSFAVLLTERITASTSFILLNGVFKAPTCELSHSVAAHLSQSVVVARLGSLNECIKQVLDFCMLTDAVARKPSNKLEAERFEELSRDLLDLSCQSDDHRE